MVSTPTCGSLLMLISVVPSIRRRGIEARRKSVAPVGAWFSQVGRLHLVHHMWQYPYAVLLLYSLWSILGFRALFHCIRNLQTRRDVREKAWQNDGWAETVSKVR